MKSTFIIAAGVAALAASAAWAHDSEKVSKTLALTDFEKIDIAGVYEINVKVGPSYSIALSGPQDEMDRVEASVKNGVLVLSQRDRKRGERNRNHNHGVEAVITMPSLKGFEVSGVVDGEIDGIDSDTFELEVSGVGDIEMNGQCGNLKAQVSGVGDLDAEGFECRSVDVDVSGVGSASVFASEEVAAHISGMGDIDVYGKPEKVEKNKSMFSDITVH